ncbi:peptide/nickel transport system permease protein [Rhodoligotrophos appendicifer]|uniref:ABC transporter permease n=1 Tax=Rhodoligotrophos appendicifer TaxID=987056 RepID=UPI001185513C|nr:ABC transporter permease [Rhodoligotrophos appendicifer]
MTDSTATPAATARSRRDSASQWRLVWWQFRRHKLAMVSSVVLLLIILVAAFCEFVAPFAPDAFSPRYTYAPPQALHLLDRDAEGGLIWRPHVYGYKVTVEPSALRRIFVIDESKKYPVGFFVKSDPYPMWGGLFTLETKLFGPLNKGDPFYLLGADRLGRDLFSRTAYGTRISMSIGLIGVTLSLLLGIVLGGISGYRGGAVDNIIQRVIEFILSLPTTPLWLGLAAAMPSSWPPLRIYLAITIILSLIGWTNLARVVRGRFLSLRTEDFVTAARLDGASEPRVIFRHMAPSFTSHIIAEVSLAIPTMILAETALSFLGLGLQPPIVSWGVLLQEAQNIRAIATAPWLFAPGIAVVIAVLSLNFVGDGLRDAADPYRQ